MKYFRCLECRRYGICQKHNIPFEYVEQEFASRYDVINEMFKIQFDRRNMSSRTKTYLVGKRYLIEKNKIGNPNGFAAINQLGKNYPIGEKDRSSKTIADQVNVTEKTVRNAAEFTLAVDHIVQVTGIAVNDILTGKIDDPMDKIKDLAEKEPETIKRVIELAIADDITVVLATSRFEKENYERQMKEADEKRKQVDKQLREKREAEEAKERERLRIEHEARVKQENERLAKEKEEQEKRRLAEIEKQRKAARQIYT